MLPSGEEVVPELYLGKLATRGTAWLTTGVHGCWRRDLVVGVEGIQSWALVSDGGCSCLLRGKQCV